MINCHKVCILENEHLYGPGKRVLIYLQGCSIHCKGCFNSHLWNFGEGSDYSSDDILDICKKEEVEGVTVLGGEPLDQAEGLLEIVRSVKASGYTVILFTGYVKKELSGVQTKIWNLSDLVICGRYVESKQNLYLQFRGSTNQRVIRHKGKYKDYRLSDGETEAVITIENGGEMNFKGFYPDDLKNLLKDIVRR